uniref:DNA cytosine methyltransferase n=1 Tax=Staphylococcus epidermidis TaxID=1282 RepID=UPI001642D05B
SIPVTADVPKLFHYTQNTPLTTRHLPTIQTFPHHFIFKATTINLQQQIPNALPPNLPKLIPYQLNLPLTHRT